MGRERQTLEQHCPGLEGALAKRTLAELERPGGDAIATFRAHGGPGLLVPARLGGKGAGALAAVRASRALGARAPSLAIATTMHHLTAVLIAELDLYGEKGAELLRDVARKGTLLASGFAEGRSGAGVLDATARADAAPGGYRVTGSKKPCSLSASMGAVMVGVSLTGRPGQRGVAMIPADAPGIRRRPFWAAEVLGGAESDELVFEDVFVPADMTLVPETAESLGRVEVAETVGLSWFELLISAAYVGVASALAERVIAAGKGVASERALLAIELEGAASALEGVARRFEADGPSVELLAHALLVRYAAQRSVERAAMHAVELLGGVAFVRSNDVSYLLAASRALALHPPNRLSMSDFVSDYLTGAFDGT
ncbi:MAG TPA: acyl-CoA dehydrogenase family protein [Polyangiaceae bacterium]|nr:acyl-CoA dehydrogenase family protein [Polyangiaceae bacterium]